MRLVRLTPDYEFGAFDCGDEDLNGFLLGSKLMDLLKDIVEKENSCSAFRFLTVDAYLSAIGFYQKNGFRELNQKDEDEHTRLMYFDMQSM